MADKKMDLNKDHPGFHKVISWKRGMTEATLLRRYGISKDLLNADVSALYFLDGNFSNPFPVCPECSAVMKIKQITLGDPMKTKVYYLVCTKTPDLKDHGFDKWSKHSVRAPMGPKSKQKDERKDAPESPKEENKVEIEVKVNTDIVVHPEVIRAAKYALAGERQIYFSGPAGTGKSTAAEHLLGIMKGEERWASADIEMITVSMSTFVTDLAGFLDRLNKGEYLETNLVKALRKPSLVVVDEADKGNPNLAGFWNTILANNKITTPGGTFDRHPDNVVLFIGNTTGHAPSKQYSGSVRQDFATLDRFRCFNIGFLEVIERAAIPNLNQNLYDLVTKIRKNAETSGLQRIVGLRWLRRVQQAMRIEGLGAKDTILQVMKDECWSNDEILASGINDAEKTVQAPSKIKYY